MRIHGTLFDPSQVRPGRVCELASREVAEKMEGGIVYQKLAG